MKKIISAILTLVMVVCISFPSNAQETTTVASEIEYLGNGLYGITTYEESDGIAAYSTNTKSVTRKYTIQNSSNEDLAIYTLKATFTYTGTSSTCTSSTYTTEIIDSSWSFSSATASKSLNVATGSFTAKCKVLGITMQTVEKTLKITCDISGNIIYS